MRGLRISIAVVFSVVACSACGGSGGRHAQAPAANSSAAETGPEAAEAQEATTPTDSAAPKPTRPNNQAGTALVREIETWDKTAVVGEGSGKHALGGMGITVDEAPVWPPQGPGCEQLIRCCNERVAAKSEAALPCLLSVTKNKSCAKALATVNAIGIEQKQAQPASCDAPPIVP